MSNPADARMRIRLSSSLYLLRGLSELSNMLGDVPGPDRPDHGLGPPDHDRFPAHVDLDPPDLSRDRPHHGLGPPHHDRFPAHVDFGGAVPN